MPSYFVQLALLIPAGLSIAAGTGLALAFIRRQRTLESPLVDLQLFRVPAFSTALVTYLLATFATFGVYVFLGQYLQLVLNMSPLEAGLWTLPWTAAFIVGSNLTPRLLRRFSAVTLMAAGLVVTAIGFALLTQVGGPSGFVVLIAGSAIYSLGLSPVFTLTNDIILGNAPPERAGSASAISETSSELGGALGIAILGSIGMAVYRSRVADSIPASLPAADAAGARATLGGALAAARRLPDQAAEGLLGQARAGFTQAFELISAICCVIAILMAVGVFLVLRRGGGSAAVVAGPATPVPGQP